MRMVDLLATAGTADTDRLKQFWTAFRLAAAVAWAWTAQHLDGRGVHGLVEVYCLFILWDFLTGVLASALQHRVKSCIALRGILKKLMGLSFVAIAHSVDVALASQLGTADHQHTIMNTVCRLMIGYEIISIAENLSAAGITFPPIMKDAIRKFTEGSGPATEATGPTGGADGTGGETK